MVPFHKTLSDESVSFRWLHMIGLSQRIAHERLMNTCAIDYEQEMALVVDYDNPVTNQHEILGVGRIVKAHDANEAEFALLVSDHYQHQGLGSELLQRLIQFSREKHIQRLTGYILADNQGMQKVCKKLGFRLWYSQEDQVMKAERVF